VAPAVGNGHSRELCLSLRGGGRLASAGAHCISLLILEVVWSNVQNDRDSKVASNGDGAGADAG
jgi:hypothetical protein